MAFCTQDREVIVLRSCLWYSLRFPVYFSAQGYKWAPKNCLEDLKKFLTKGGGGGRREGGRCESVMEQFLIEGEWQYLGLNLLMKENQMNILSFSKMCFLIVELYTTFISWNKPVAHGTTGLKE